MKNKVVTFILLVTIFIFIPISLIVSNYQIDLFKKNNLKSHIDGYVIDINKSALFNSYFNNKTKLTLTNNSNKEKTLNLDTIFYSNQQILTDIGINNNDTDKVKADKINSFVSKLKFKYPLYVQSTLNPSLVYSTRGFGDCGTYSKLICAFSFIYNLPCNNWGFNGHAAAEVFYDNNWHLYDPSGIGTIIHDNQVADLEYVISLAKDKKLSVYNNEFSNTSDHRQIKYPYLNKNELLSFHLNATFLPYERKIFFNDLFFIDNSTTDMNREYENVISNFVREIPINETRLENKIEISDVFPIIGVFIITNQKPSIFDYPHLTFSNGDITYTDNTNHLLFNNKHILDLSSKISHELFEKTSTVTITNINELINKTGPIKILTIHTYSKDFSNFSRKNLNDLKNIEYVLNQ